MSLPVLDTRQVLLDHLLAKITPLCTSKLVAKKILLEIANNLPNKEILELLQKDDSLVKTVAKFDAFTNEKEQLGEKLYYRVQNIEVELCPKITGMLMELDANTLKKLLADEKLLEKAVNKSKKEFQEYAAHSKKSEELGEGLYTLVCKHHKPDIASHLTGMLLELDEGTIHRLLNNPKEFEKKLEIAYNTFVTYCSS